MKIETLNSEVVQSKGIAPELRAFVETPRRGVSTVPDIKSGDSLNLSVSFPSAGKNLSVLLSSLIDILGELEGSPNPPESPFAKGGLLNPPLLLKGGEGGFVDFLFYKGEEPLTFLKAFIENSGLLYEAKLAKGDIRGIENDLKGLLLRLIEKKGEHSEAGKTARLLLTDIEARQLLNIKGKEEGVFYFQIPVPLPQGASTAEVYVRRDGKGKGGYQDDSYRIGFEIDLREAGLVSIDVLVGRKGRDVTCYVSTVAENAEFHEFLESQLPELTERLSGYGMRLLLREGVDNG